MLTDPIDGLASFPEAIASVFPTVRVRLCIVHVVRAGFRCL